MGSFTYTATDSLLPGRSYGTVVTLEIDVQEARRARKVEKDMPRSMGGAMEVLKHRADVSYSVTFEPVSGHRLLELREFLDSTEGGEQFSVDLYGDSAVQLPAKRLDEGYNENPFMRRGSEDTDMFDASIEILLL